MKHSINWHKRRLGEMKYEIEELQCIAEEAENNFWCEQDKFEEYKKKINDAVKRGVKEFEYRRKNE